MLCLVGCETTYTALGLDYVKWNTTSGNGNFQNKKGDSFFICAVPYFSSNPSKTPPIASVRNELRAYLSKYGRVDYTSKSLNLPQGLACAKGCNSKYLLLLEIDAVHHRNMFSWEGDSISMYDVKSEEFIYTKSVKIVAQNRGLVSTSLTSVAKEAIPAFVNPMFK